MSGLLKFLIHAKVAVDTPVPSLGMFSMELDGRSNGPTLPRTTSSINDVVVESTLGAYILDELSSRLLAHYGFEKETNASS